MSEEDEEIKIEKNLAITESPRRSNKIVSAMRKMNIGDSFILPDSYQRSGGNLHMYADVAGIVVTTRKQENGKIRLWRIQ